MLWSYDRLISIAIATTFLLASLGAGTLVPTAEARSKKCCPAELYSSSSDVQRVVNNRLREKGMKPEDFKWLGDENPPKFVIYNGEAVGIVGLYLTLSTFQETAEFYAQWVADNNRVAWSGNLDREHLRDFRDPEEKEFKPWTRQWFVAEFAPNYSPNGLRETRPEKLAGLEVLAIAAEHPRDFAYRTKTEQYYQFQVTALDYRESTEHPWSVPLLLHNRPKRKVHFVGFPPNSTTASAKMIRTKR